MASLIRIECRCGKTFNPPESYAGKVVKCRDCGAKHTVPFPNPFEAMIESARRDEGLSWEDPPPDSENAVPEPAPDRTTTPPPPATEPKREMLPPLPRNTQPDTPIDPWYLTTLEIAGAVSLLGALLLAFIMCANAQANPMPILYAGLIAAAAILGYAGIQLVLFAARDLRASRDCLEKLVDEFQKTKLP